MIGLLALQPAPRSDQFDDGTHHCADRVKTNRPKTHRGRGLHAQHTNDDQGFKDLVSVTLTQGMTSQKIGELIVQAVDHRTLIIPDTLRTTDGQPDIPAMLATLVDTNTPTTSILKCNVGNTYVVLPGDSLASITVKYYRLTDAVNDIFLGQHRSIEQYRSIAGWTDDFSTAHVICVPNPRLAFRLGDWLYVRIQKRPHPQDTTFPGVRRQNRSV